VTIEDLLLNFHQAFFDSRNKRVTQVVSLPSYITRLHRNNCNKKKLENHESDKLDAFQPTLVQQMHVHLSLPFNESISKQDLIPRRQKQRDYTS
jgi:hypothetical protein